MDYFKFNRPFRVKILSLLLDNNWMGSYSTLLSSEYFEADDERDVCAALLTYYNDYGTIPRDAEDVIALCGYEHAEFVYALFDWENDTRLAEDLVLQWAKEQAAKNAILESVDDIKKGDLSKIIPRLKEALAVGDNHKIPGIDFIEDVDSWLYDLWIDKVRTGWYHVDLHLDGGLGRGELGYVMAPSNRGKSMALVNIAYGAAGIGSAKNVVIFTHEMSAKLYAKRIAARMLFRFPRREDGHKQYEEDLRLVAKKLMPGNIRIVGGKMSVYDVESHLKQMVANDFMPDVVIDDYSDLLAPPYKRSEKRFELSEIAGYLRDIGKPGAITEEGMSIWSATQSGRDSYNKAIIREDDISEDIGKVAVSDVIIALCQTTDEYKEDRCRLYMAKVRDGKRGHMVAAKYFSDSQCIITIEDVDMSGGINV